MAETEQKKDFFISRNKADSDWGKWIAWQLEEEGYTTVLQDWDFRPSQNFVLKMHSAATNCERTIAVLSAAYFAAEFSASEWAARFVEDPTGEDGKLITVRVAECDPPGLLKAIIYIDLVGRDKASAKDALLEGVKRDRLKPSKAPGFPGGRAPRFPGGLPDIWNVPHLRNPNFTGREDLLTQLREKLRSGEAAALTQAISGLGGVGKTQLAIEYAYRHASDYGLVWWVRSEDAAALSSDYAGLAAKLDLAEKDAQKQEDAVEAVRRWLEHNGAWLLVFDNVPAPKEVLEYLPQGATGQVIITSRDPNWGGVASPLSVQKWERSESVLYLLKRTGKDDEDAARALADALGDLPLALAQAAAYIEETGRSFSHYLELFEAQQQELLKRGTAFSGYELTVATTWEASFQQIEKDSPAASDLLNLCAFLAPDDIPLDIMRDGSKHLPGRLAGVAGDDLAWDAAIAALRRYSLVEVSGDGLSVHRLVQAVTRDRLPEEDRREWAGAGAAVAIVNGAFPTDVQANVDAWPLCSRLLPHALAAAGHAEELEDAPNPAARLLNKAGLYLRVRAQFTDARRVHERALRIAESYHGSDHPEVAAHLNNLGSLLAELGDLPGARLHLERALRIGEAAYGQEGPEVAPQVNNLGLVLQELGDPAGARAHFERSLRIDEAAHGPDYPDVAIRLNNLGCVLQSLGDPAGARAHLERALRIIEIAYDANHPYLASIVNNLGSVLKELGDPAGARAHYERALRIDEAAYGPDHPDLAIRMTNLASVLRDDGDLAGARAHYDRALELRRRLLGDDHPATIRSKVNLESLDE